MRDTPRTRRFRLLLTLAVAGCWAIVAAALPAAAGAEPSVPPPTRLAAPSSVFSDVQGDEWYAEAAQALAAKAVMLRHYDGSFDAEGTVTRGEMAYFLTRALGLEESPDQPFSDIQAWDWFAGSVGVLFQAGLIPKTDPLVFSPQHLVTRQEAAAMVMNAFANAGGDQAGGDQAGATAEPQLTEKEARRWLKGFSDRRLIDPANAVSVANAWRLGILDAPAEGRFSPADPLSRAEMATMLYRAFLGPVADGTVGPEDLSTEAAYESLEVGSKGTLVSFLESRLTALHYPCGPVDGVYDYRTRDGVMAFQKVEQLERTGRVNEQVWGILATATDPQPRRSGKGTRCEVDIARQVLFMITDNKVTKVVHVSTGKNGTRTGHFRIQEKYKGWIDCITVNDYMYYPSYIVGKIAVHGYPSVPAYPASHGCVRTPVWITEEVFRELRTGTVIDIFR